jgi:hypothetical protein
MPTCSAEAHESSKYAMAMTASDTEPVQVRVWLERVCRSQGNILEGRKVVCVCSALVQVYESNPKKCGENEYRNVQFPFEKRRVDSSLSRRVCGQTPSLSHVGRRVVVVFRIAVPHA